ncbi:hypothetical protein V6N11_056182 [Hibiscus sabdariffa]|uniref:Uncharacterized protein n=1 Tax=Hibiscus sabdariffa TaxID=183260 RepID=A0ABR2T3R8_9ROSI
MVFSSPRRRRDCLRSAWPTWFASHGAAPGSLALVAMAGRGPRSGLVLAVVSRVRDGPRVRSHVSFPPSRRALFVTACGSWLLPFWEPRLRFVQRRVALLLAPLCTAGRDGAVLYACSIARIVVPMHVHWPALGVGLGLTILARLWLEYCMPFWELRLLYALEISGDCALLVDIAGVF